MNMKKWISIALVLAIAIGIMCFAGCRREEPSSPVLSGDHTTPTTPTTPTAPANPVVDPEKDNSKEPPVEAPTMPEETDPQDTKPVDPEQNATQPEATEPEETQPETTEPEATEPEATDPPATQPTPTEPGKSQLVEEYEAYLAMDGSAQTVYMLSFPSVEDFVKWFNEAKAAYDAYIPPVIVDGKETIDLGP